MKKLRSEKLRADFSVTIEVPDVSLPDVREKPSYALPVPSRSEEKSEAKRGRKQK